MNKTSTIHNGREITNGSDALWYRFKMIDDVYFRMAYASISQIFVLESVCSVSARATVSTLRGQWNGDGINRALVKTWLTALSRPTEVTSVLAAFSLSPPLLSIYTLSTSFSFPLLTASHSCFLSRVHDKVANASTNANDAFLRQFHCKFYFLSLRCLPNITSFCNINFLFLILRTSQPMLINSINCNITNVTYLYSCHKYNLIL